MAIRGNGLGSETDRAREENASHEFRVLGYLWVAMGPDALTWDETGSRKVPCLQELLRVVSFPTLTHPTLQRRDQVLERAALSMTA